MDMKNNILILLVITGLNLFTGNIPAAGTSLPERYATTDFSTKNGVEDGLVNDMLQDRKGLLWFATWNGLYRFDGYGFRNYKSDPEDPGGLTNDRLLQITEDRYGCIWTLCYDSTAYRFHPGRETFEPMPRPAAVNFRSILVLPGGAVWLLYTDGSALRASTRPADLSLTLEPYPGEEKARLTGKIRTVHQDASGREWILTDNGLYRLQEGRLRPVTCGGPATGPHDYHCVAEKNDTLLLGGGKGRTYACLPNGETVTVRPLETDATVIAIRHGRRQTVYVTDSDGFFVGGAEGRPRHFTLDRLTLRTDRTIESATLTGGRLLWLTHPGPGVTLFDLDTQTFGEFMGRDETGRPLATETGFFAVEDCNGVLWIHPKGGAFSYYDPHRRTLVPFNTTGQAVKWKSNDRCFAAFADKQGNLWMSTQLDRLKRVTFIPDKFHFHVPQPNDPDLPENEIRALHIDRQGRIWTGSRDMNISVYDARFNLLHRFRAGKVYAITQDADGTYWISTKGEGLIGATERADGSFDLQRYTHRADDPYSISSNNIYHVYQDRRQRLWVATYGGGVNLAERQAGGRLRFVHPGNRLKNYPIQRFHKARHITEDREGNIWISTTAGILHLDGNFREPETIAFGRICREQGNAHSLSNNDVHLVTCTTRGQIFAVTYGGGLNELVKTAQGEYRCHPFTQKDGLISDIIYAMQEDCDGNLWLVTGGGLVKYTGAREHTQYPSEHITPNMHFSEGEGAGDGRRIFFGTNRGVFWFDPRKVRKTDFVPPIFFSSVRIDNTERSLRNTPGLLPPDIDSSARITLPPGSHTLRIVFSALDMTNTEYIHYACMMQGIDSVWRQTGHEHEVNYAHLPPGRYTFRVRSTNSEGVWVDNERTLSVEVLPARPAIPHTALLIITLAVAVPAGIVYTRRRRRRPNDIPPAPAPALSEKDAAFLARLSRVMEERMNDPDLSVDYLVSCTNLSRTNFFHKLKTLTGLSPVMYIRDARMKKAAGLIRQHRYSIAEVAYMVGYSDPHYFSRIFKLFWGMNATEYARKES